MANVTTITMNKRCLSIATHRRTHSKLMYQVRRGLPTSQSQLCARPPSSIAFANNFDNG